MDSVLTILLEWAEEFVGHFERKSVKMELIFCTSVTYYLLHENIILANILS